MREFPIGMQCWPRPRARPSYRKTSKLDLVRAQKNLRTKEAALEKALQGMIATGYGVVHVSPINFWQKPPSEVVDDMKTSVPQTKPPGAGWRRWDTPGNPSPYDYVEVECWRAGWNETSLQAPEAHPWMNANGLYWRPAGPLKRGRPLPR